MKFRKPFIVIAMLALALAPIAPVQAALTNCNGTVTNGETVGNCIAAAGDQLVVDQGGIINTPLSLPTIQVNVVAMTSIVNNGSILYNGFGGYENIRLTSGGSIGSLTNNTGGVLNAGVYITSSSNGIGQIYNDGTIFGLGGGGIDLGGGNTTLVANDTNGQITGNFGGFRIFGAGTVVDTFVNKGLIKDAMLNPFRPPLMGIGPPIDMSQGAIRLDDATLNTLINSGTLSRGNGTYAVNVRSGALGKIIIAGDDTAVFDGQVKAAATPVTIASDATYSLKTADDFRVQSFTNHGTAILGNGVNFTLANVTGNTFANQGVLRLNDGAVGTLTGNYTQTADGTLQTNVSNDTTYGQLVVTGTATLPSNAKIDVNVADANFNFTTAVNDDLADVISAGTLVSDGTFAVTDNSVLFSFSASKDGNTVDLALARDIATSVLRSTQAVGNAQAEGAAKALDTVLYDPALSGNLAWQPVVSALGLLTSDEQVSNAASQTLPLLAGSANAATLNAQHVISRIVQARQKENQGLSSGDVFYGDKNVWGNIVGNWASQDDHKDASGYDADSNGLIFGADAEVGNSDRAGVAFAYYRSDVDGNSSVAPSSADIDSYHLAGYGSHAIDARTEITYQADVAYHDTDGRRRIVFMNQVASSEYDSWSAHAGVGLNRIYSLSDKVDVVPAVRVDYTWLESESYRETGAGALNLDVDSNDTDEFVVSVGSNLNYAFNDRATLAVNVGVGYDLINDESSITSAFAGNPSATFVTEGIDPSPWLLTGGLGFVFQLNEAMELNVRYDLDAREDFNNQAISAKMKWAF